MEFLIVTEQEYFCKAISALETPVIVEETSGTKIPEVFRKVLENVRKRRYYQ